MYANGEGVLQDNIKAHMWWNIARANGEKEYADNNIKRITKSMTPAGYIQSARHGQTMPSV
jgi:hypothetical protein